MDHNQRKLAIVPKFILTGTFVSVVPACVAAGCSDSASDVSAAQDAAADVSSHVDANDVFQADVSAHFIDGFTGDVSSHFDAQPEASKEASSEAGDGGDGGPGGDAADGANDAPSDGG